MCDCPQKQYDKTIEKIGPETVTLFSKCPTPYRPGKDILEHTIPSGSDRMPIDSVQSSSSDTMYDSTKVESTLSIDTQSSSESSRIYKFVCPTKYDYSDEESFKLSPVCIETSRIKETVEEEPEIEYTLAIIKPEAVIYRKEIENQIYEEGFEICQTRWLQLTPEQAAEFYNNRFGELSFPNLVAYMSSGSIIVFVLAKQNAVEEWKRIVGPTTVTEARLYFPDSIRARYGRKGDNLKNAIHGSCNREQAEKEIHFFFPRFITEPVLRVEMAEDFLWETINPVLVEGLTMCCKQKPADPVLWLAHWLILNNPNKPKLPEDLALIPT
ncbi:PREDICTED: nucleoside diphosphate kinase homolog 5-like [Trachymyrmex cornetzi]|uniref:Nucleoside diphosphate kinase like protein 5 n=1 Tax=Trachymyrmex cornetzi TaxID=471704 RepID=A0A195EDH3_9HYME|nr:PREDICTED: nucleoside diphosphate kinase homolog 5-like [Trachymyrmex cornetzi]KYN23258.1 Nucleoside diphosphate kinase like protein 5 [Trachymyrmex cornetzi]